MPLRLRRQEHDPQRREASRPATPTTARNPPLASSRARPSASAATSETASVGVGTRTSEMRRWPMRRTFRSAASSAYPAIDRWDQASQWDRYESATARTALGKSTDAIGMTSALAGSAMVVARWKYQAIGKRQRQLDDGRDEKQFGGSQQQTCVMPHHQKVRRRGGRPPPAMLSRTRRSSTRNSAARVGCAEVVFRRIEISQPVLQRIERPAQVSAPRCRQPRSRKETSAESWLRTEFADSPAKCPAPRCPAHSARRDRERASA